MRLVSARDWARCGGAIGRPGNATTGTLHCVVKSRRFLYTLPRNTDHALWTTAPLRRGITHPSSYQALRLQTIQGRIERSDRASAFGCAFYLLPDCSAVSVFTQPRGRAQQQVLELAEHDYHHIVILMAIRVKLGMPCTRRCRF